MAKKGTNVKPNQDLAFDPEYWEKLAEGKRALAEALHNQPEFAGVLLEVARMMDRLAIMALHMKQQRRTLLGIEPRFRAKKEVQEIPGFNPPLRVVGNRKR